MEMWLAARKGTNFLKQTDQTSLGKYATFPDPIAIITYLQACEKNEKQ